MTKLVNSRFHTDISESTVCRCRQELKFEYRPPKVVQDLSPQQVEQRVEFCQWVLSHEQNFQNVIFSDESRFETAPDNRWRRIKRGNWNETACATRKKYPEGIMVWGAIGRNYRTELILCSKGVTGEEYREIIQKSKMIDDLNGLYGRGGWIFMQDGAPAHTCKATIEWLDKQRVCIVPGWPPNSPDLNPIEMIWGLLKRRMPDDWREQQDLFTNVARSWQALSRDSINMLVDSFVARCRLVLSLGGCSATPWLRAHRTDPLPGQVQVRGPEVISQEEEQRIHALYVELGPRWARISRAVGRSPTLVRYVINRIEQERRNLHILSLVDLPPIDTIMEKCPSFEEFRAAMSQLCPRESSK